ncbi:MAG: hypothetical protein ACI4DU_07200 [Lachnospiraceae bacterium]
MQFIIFTGGEKNDLFDLLFADLKQLNNVVIDSRLPKIPKVLHGLWKLHHARKWNEKNPLPFRNIWNKFSPLKDLSLKPEEEYCLVFNNVSLPWFEPGQLNALKKKYHVHLAMYFLDSFRSYYSQRAQMNMRQVDFDLIYTFHKPDAVPGKIDFFDTYYSTHILENRETAEGLPPDLHDTEETEGFPAKSVTGLPADEDYVSKTDAFFWGIDSGRGKKIEEVYEVLTKAGLNCRFGICYSDEHREKKDGIIYNRPIPYPEVLRQTMQTNCIVDIVGDYSGGISLRAYEAVTYGKKLLTDNPLVKEMRYYHPDRMQVFSKPEEINFTFFQKNSPPDYGYTDAFSPIHFIARMEKELQDRAVRETD